MKILWLTNIPSPYRVCFFNELGKSCDLTVLFERNSSDERDSSWKYYKFDNFKFKFLRGIKVGASTSFSPEIIKYLSINYDKIIVHDFSTPTGILTIIYLKLHKKRYIIESDGALLKKENKWKKFLKSKLLRGAEKYFSTAEVNDNYFINYGISRDKIVRYPFTSIYHSDILKAVPTYEEKCEIRKHLRITEKTVILAVGRIIPLKGYDVLIEASKNMSKDIGIYIVGGSPPLEYINEIQSSKLFNIHFVEFQLKEVLNQYYMAADLFVHPTRSDIWGLVINEAMAKGLPIITTDKCVAGLEMVKDGINGYIIPVNNSSKLIKAIHDIIPVAHNMSNESLKAIRMYTIENMAKKHIELFKG